jgi:hypothetical protein
VPQRRSAKVEARDLAAEIIRRTRATADSSDSGDSLPYVVRLSDPPPRMNGCSLRRAESSATQLRSCP